MKTLATLNSLHMGMGLLWNYPRGDEHPTSFFAGQEGFDPYVHGGSDSLTTQNHRKAKGSDWLLLKHDVPLEFAETCNSEEL